MQKQAFEDLNNKKELIKSKHRHGKLLTKCCVKCIRTEHLEEAAKRKSE